jgi:predicted transcriptional regulator
MALGNLRREIDLVLRHIRVLEVLHTKEPIGIRKISCETGIPIHQVRYSLRVLERAGVLNPTSKGARLTDDVDDFVDQLALDLGDLEGQLSEIVRLAHGLRSDS